VSRTLLLGLMRDRYVATGKRNLDLVATLADDNDPFLRTQPIDRVEQMKQQGAPGDRVQNLVRVGAHASALSGSQDHHCKIR
jgi:hypothetical protein